LGLVALYLLFNTRLGDCKLKWMKLT
jgi:hypothetical protein